MKMVIQKEQMSIYIAVQKAKELCHEKGLNNIRMIYNDIELHVYHNSNDCDIATIYSLMMEMKRIGHSC
jgi:hypothetical protein